jgi:dolichol-phosphate mannosyltransferase
MTVTPLEAGEADGRTAPRISVVIPARNETARIGRALARIFASVRSSCEVIVIVDDEEDPTWQEVQARAAAEPRLRCLVGGYGPGPANAIRFGIDQARAGVAVVTMADNSDDPRQIEPLAALVENGAAVAAASRYSKGGSQIGGPIGKSLLSRLAGRSLRLLARAGTSDATNSFKAYSTSFIREVGIDSRQGFAIGIELTAKARRLRRDVAEIPTIWLDREDGESGFRILAWIPAYLRWYLFCFGRRLTVGELAARSARRARPATEPVPPARDPTPLVPRQTRTSEWAAWHVIAAKDELVGAGQARGAAPSREAAQSRGAA